MSDAVIIAAVMALAPTLTACAALGAFIVSLLTNRKTTKVLNRTEDIHQLADGNLSAMRETLDKATAALAVANEKIVALEKTSGEKILALEKTISRWMLDKGVAS